MDLKPFAILVASAMPALADYDPTQYPAYETCALCHGLFGVSHTAKFPNLGGQKPSYIEAQLNAFIAGERTNDGGQMATIVTELMPEDIPIVVEWFSTQDPPEPYEAEGDGSGEAVFADLGCASCHDNSAEGSPTVPYLTSQHAGYLVKQMTDFKEGDRDTAEAPGMHRDLLAITEDQIAAIADYLASTARQ
ncbi:MAG: c-type cytochrome [Pseudomonadota bacterium]